MNTNYSVVSQNEVLKNTTETDDYEIALDIYRAYIEEMDYPHVELIDGTTGEVLMYHHKTVNVVDYISPCLLAEAEDEEVESEGEEEYV